MTTTISTTTLSALSLAASKVIAGKKPSGLDEHYNKFIFNGEEMYASTHEVGLSVKLKTSFKGALDGRIFKSILDTMTGDTITLTPAAAQDSEMASELSGDYLDITDGHTKVSLPLEPLDIQVALLPLGNLPDAKEYDLDEKSLPVMRKLLSKVIPIAAQDDTRDWLRSVHFFDEDDELAAYSSSGFQIALAKDKSKNPIAKYLDGQIVNSFWARVFLEITEGTKKKVSLRVSASYIQAAVTSAGGEFVLQAGIAEMDQKREFRGPFLDVVDKLKETLPAKIPAEFPSVVIQSRILLHDKVHPLVSLAIEGGKLLVQSGSVDLRGQLRSRPMDAALPDVKVQAAPDRLALVLDEEPTHFVIDPAVIFFSGETKEIKFAYLVSVVS